jgi:arginine:ornithine antiporter/lysine permease
MSAVVPAFGAGDTVAAVIVSSIGVWLFVFLVLRGVKDAAVINYIVTIAKVVPILVFIVIAIVAFKADIFTDNFWGGEEYSPSSIWDQATGTMLITVFVFLGIEGAAFTRGWHASGMSGAPMVIGFSVSLCFRTRDIGVVRRHAAGRTRGEPPSMAAVLESIVVPWDQIFIRVGGSFRKRGLSA